MNRHEEIDHLSVVRLCRNLKKNNLLERERGGRGCWAACREAACQRINETLPKDLER